jgi:chemotaxis protein methyltransferase CheR
MPLQLTDETAPATTFFHGREDFEFLERQILPELTEMRRQGEKQLRFWSAGCDTGEEPYSIALLLDHCIPDIHGWKIKILATGRNLCSFKKAAEGVYDEAALAHTPKRIRIKYFKRYSHGTFRVIRRIREMVRFMYLDPTSDRYPSPTNGTIAMDVIFCRDLPEQFDADVRECVLGRLSRALTEGGWLIVGADLAPLVPQLPRLQGALGLQDCTRLAHGQPCNIFKTRSSAFGADQERLF